MTKASATALLRELENDSSQIPSPSRTRLRQETLTMLRQNRLVEPAYSYRIVPLEPGTGPDFVVEGTRIHAPRLLPASGELTALAFCVFTLGDALERHVSELFSQRKAALAITLDDLANEMLMGLSRRVEDRIIADVLRQRLSMAGELHAGDPGLDLSAQAAVLRLAEGDKIGIGLHNGHLLTPLKSGSVVYGIGKNLPAVSWSRCDHCPSKEKCRFGRRPKAPIHPALLATS